MTHRLLPPVRVVATLLAALAAAAAGARAQGVALAPPVEPAVEARAELVPQGQPGQGLEIVERARPGGGLDRRFLRNPATPLYRAVVDPLPDGFELQVLQGHPDQLGRYRLSGSRLEVHDGQGRPLWSERLSEPLCLPEMFGEFIRAHWDRLKPGSEPLRCLTPIIKARKVAPLQWRRLPDGPAGERVVEVGPGSFGMRFFVVPTRLSFDAAGERLLAQQGQFEAPVRLDGRASYLRGNARYVESRTIAVWPIVRFGTAATVP